MPKTTIQNLPIGNLKPYERNTKKHPKKQVRQVADSISAFGFNQPIVVDKNMVVVVGHGRLEAAKLLEMETVPVLVLDLTEQQARAYRLADNKLNESDWDMQMVIQELKDLDLVMLDLTGFSRDLVIETRQDEDVVPALPKKAKSKLGDLYRVGDHFVMCGDSTSAADVEKLMGGVQADMVFTDPPYNVDYSGKGKKTSNKILNDKMSDDAFLSFLVGAFTRMRESAKKSAGVYVFHDFTSQDVFALALERAGFEIVNQLIWNKPTGGLGMGNYRKKHEPFYYCRAKGQKVRFYGDRTNVSVVDVHGSAADLIEWAKREKRAEEEGKTTIWTMKRDNVNEYVHPTQKPVELIGYALQNNSKAGDTVLDLFGGSGSTLIACEKFNRNAYLMELDPRYADTIVQRYVDFTGTTEVFKNGKKINWPKSEDT